MSQKALPLGRRVALGEQNGRRIWERRIRETKGEMQIHLRFPEFEGGEALNRLIEEMMVRYYAFAAGKRAKVPFSAVMRWRWEWEEERVLLILTGYTGASERYAPEERLRLYFLTEGKMEFDGKGKKLPKKREGREKARRGC